MAGADTDEGFSLVEVVLALGIFAVAVVSVLALLPATARLAAVSRDLQTAARLCDSIKLETRRQVPPADFISFKSLQLVAERDGTRVRLLDPAENAGGQYFLIEVSPYGREPLQFAVDTPLLVLAVRISWPFRPVGPGGLAPATSPSSRDEFDFVFSVRP